jgi:hypothetical protein
MRMKQRGVWTRRRTRQGWSVILIGKKKIIVVVLLI